MNARNKCNLIKFILLIFIGFFSSSFSQQPMVSIDGDDLIRKKGSREWISIEREPSGQDQFEAFLDQNPYAVMMLSSGSCISCPSNKDGFEKASQEIGSSETGFAILNVFKKRGYKPDKTLEELSEGGYPQYLVFVHGKKIEFMDLGSQVIYEYEKNVKFDSFLLELNSTLDSLSSIVTKTSEMKKDTVNTTSVQIENKVNTLGLDICLDELAAYRKMREESIRLKFGSKKFKKNVWEVSGYLQTKCAAKVLNTFR